MTRLPAGMSRLLYLCFLCSGLSGLVYQVVWVRMFGNVFGNTIYSASLVVAVFMLGLGAGSYLVGTWADRRYAVRPESLLRVFAWFEVGIAAIGLAIAAVLPHLGEVMALLSSVSRDANGWYVLSATSHAVRTGVAIVLLTPITLMMGGTLTLLIRFLVRTDLMVGRQRIAVLYGVNTAGAAAGAFLTDFAFVPAVGLGGAQLVALGFNLIAAGGALYLARRAGLGVKRMATEERVSTILASLPDRSRPPDRLDPRSVRLCGDGIRDPLVSPFHAAARRVPRGVFLVADRDSRRHRGRLAPRRAPPWPTRRPGAVAHGRAGALRGFVAGRIGCRRRSRHP